MSETTDRCQCPTCTASRETLALVGLKHRVASAYCAYGAAEGEYIRATGDDVPVKMLIYISAKKRWESLLAELRAAEGEGKP